jgi:hypothetical protein
MQSAWLRATVACFVSLGFASIVSAQSSSWPACVAPGATLEPSRVDVQDGDSGCLLFFTSGNGSAAAGPSQVGSSGNGTPGALLLNSTAMVAGGPAFGSCSWFLAMLYSLAGSKGVIRCYAEGL